MLLGAYRPGSVEDFERVRRARRVRRAQATVSSAVYQSPRLAVPELVDDPIDVLFREHRLIARARPHLYVLPDPEYRAVELTGRPERRRRSLIAGLSTALTLKGAMVLTAAAAALATGGLLAATHAAPPRTRLSEPAPSVSAPAGSRAAVLPATIRIPRSVARPPLVAPAAQDPATLVPPSSPTAADGDQGQSSSHQAGQHLPAHGKGTATFPPAKPSAAPAQATGPAAGAPPKSAAPSAPAPTGGAHSATAPSGDDSANHRRTGDASGKD